MSQILSLIPQNPQTQTSETQTDITADFKLKIVVDNNLDRENYIEHQLAPIHWEDKTTVKSFFNLEVRHKDSVKKDTSRFTTPAVIISRDHSTPIEDTVNVLNFSNNWNNRLYYLEDQSCVLPALNNPGDLASGSWFPRVDSGSDIESLEHRANWEVRHGRFYCRPRAGETTSSSSECTIS